MAEQRLTDLLPAPYSGGTRQIQELVTISGASLTDYTTFADNNPLALIRQDYFYFAAGRMFTAFVPNFVASLTATGVKPTSDVGTVKAVTDYVTTQINFQRQYVYPYTIGGRVTGGIEVNNQQNNNASGRYSLVAAGSNNATGGSYALISEGSNNTASGDYSVILNGSGSAIPVGADRSFIGTGQFHTLGATASDSAIIVGQGNTINSANSLITNGTYSTIQPKGSYNAVINSNSVTINSGSTYVTAINCNGLSVPAGSANKTYINGREIQVPSATPAAIKTAVTNQANTWLNGELQGTQPAGSAPGMKFCDAQYRYEYGNGMNDTDGTTFCWISIGKYHG